jgi:signal peptide peptidase SppA
LPLKTPLSSRYHKHTEEKDRIMRLIDIVNAPWAITTDMLSEIQGIYSRHVRGEKINLANIEAAIGKPLDNSAKGYVIQEGVALLPVDGVIAKRMNLFSKISGGTSTELVGQEFDKAMADPAVKAIILLVDSPGGTVDGTPELAAKIYGARNNGKQIIAFTDGMMASAAYWIGSACHEAYCSSEVSVIGSIGVVTSHVDVSGAEAKEGIKTTEIYAGKYKRIASQYGPLTKEGKAVIQEQLDHVYSVFVEDVAKHRGRTIDQVLEAMADGRIFQGSQAVSAGLVDGVSTLADCIAALQNTQQQTGLTPYRLAGVASANQKENHAMSNPTIPAATQAGAPDCNSCQCGDCTKKPAGEKAYSAALAAAKIEGAAAERDRIAAVRGTLIPGHEALIETMAFDGVSSAADAALAIIGAEKQLRIGALSAIEDEAPPTVPTLDAADVTPSRTMKRVDFNKMAVSEQRHAISTGVKIVE